MDPQKKIEKILTPIDFGEAIQMVTDCSSWLNSVSDCIKYSAQPTKPNDFLSTQKLAVEIPKLELANIMQADKIVGIMGYDAKAKSLSLILVGVDANYKPSPNNPPHQTWPILKKVSDLNDVINIYLTP